MGHPVYVYNYMYIQCVPLATEPDISLIILTPMKSWRSLEADIRRASPAFGPCRRNWKPRGLYWTSISGKIIKEMPGSVTSETLCIVSHFCTSLCISCRLPKCNIRYISQKILMRLLQCRNKELWRTVRETPF